METSLPLLFESDTKPTLSGRLGYYLCPIRKKTVVENMRLVFGARLLPGETKRLVQSFYSHVLRVIWENIATSWVSDEELKKHVRVIGHDLLTAASRQNKGILLLTAHIGNWELAPVASILSFREFKGRFHILRRQLSNKTFEKILFRRFYRAGLDIIPKKNSLNQVLNALAKNDVVAFIMDQYARPDKDGIEVEFFGRKVGTFKSLALIARQTGAPVMPAVCYRDRDGKHVMRFSEPLPWIEKSDPDDEIYENTLAYNRVLESMIMEHPSQWMWAHRRWKVK